MLTVSPYAWYAHRMLNFTRPFSRLPVLLAIATSLPVWHLSAGDPESHLPPRHGVSPAGRLDPGVPVRRNQPAPRRSKINPAMTNISPLHWAALENRPNEVRSLLESGADPNAREQLYGDETPLHWAAIADSSAAVRLLLAGGASIDAQDDVGETALHESLKKRDSQWHALSALLTSGANPNLSTNQGWTPLMDAVLVDESDPSKAVKLLVGFGANVNAVRSDGTTALLLAAGLNGANAYNLIATLLDARANPNARYPNGGDTVLHRAVNYEHEHFAVRLIRAAGGNPNVTAGPFAATPLHVAVLAGSFEGVAALLDDQSRLGPVAQIDATDNRGTTPLHWISGFVIGAAESPSAIRVLRLLLKEGANINKRTPNGMTALGLALHEGYTDIVEQLQDAGGTL